MPGVLRRRINVDSSRATRFPGIDLSGIASKHSRVTSSTILSIRKRRPQANWSCTKYKYSVCSASLQQGLVPAYSTCSVVDGFFKDANWLARVNLLHALAQNIVAETSETQTSGYNLIKAKVSYKVGRDQLGYKELMMGITGNNRLNEQIRNSIFFRKDEIMLRVANLRFLQT